MARVRRGLRRLVEELAALSPEDRARVIDEATHPDRFRAPQKDFKVPVLTGGTRWIGGDLRRQTTYGDDDR